MTQKQMKPPPIGSKEAALIQITADQILKDAEIHRPVSIKPPVQRIIDQKQLEVYKQEKRRQFQDKLRRQRYNLSIWVRYALWQDNLKQYTRARSIFERAIQIQYTNKSLWLKYAEMQMKNKFINHARNIWQRAVHYLPRQDQFWFKYAYMQQLIGDYVKARDIFKRWMEWLPGQKSWMVFISFEERMGESQKARKVLYQYLNAYPTLQTYLKVAKFQLKNRNRDAARQIYQIIITELGNQALHQQYFIDFGKFQIKCREYDRAREIYKFGLEHIPKEKAEKLYQNFLALEKQHGSKNAIDQVILGERRNIYKSLIAVKPLNYDAWLNLLALEQSCKCVPKIRQVYQAAVKQIPPAEEERFWRRYIYIWYNYAIFEEEIAEDLSKTEQVYERAIQIVPHKKFTFSKLWILYAKFCIRCCDLEKARKIFGKAIGLNPKQKVFKSYIQLEEQLCQLDRVRMIYQKYCEKFWNYPHPWVQFASFEANLEQYDRAKQILSIAHQMRVQGLPDPDQFVEQAISQAAEQLEEQN